MAISRPSLDTDDPALLSSDPQQLWSKSSLRAAYIGLYLLTYITSLETQVTLNLTVFAASAFSAHSLISTIFVIQAVSFSILKPLAAKIATVFGRFEAFTLCVGVFVLGYIGQALAPGILVYAASGIMYSAGASGLQILQQVFIADTSDLQNRAILSTIPDVPFLVNVWIGAPLAAVVLKGPGWRWGYGVWAVVLPAVYVPLAMALWVERAKVRRLKEQLKESGRPVKMGGSLLQELDAGGLLLLSVGITFVLVPLTLAKNAADAWHSKSIITMLIVGLMCLVAFPLWERNPRLAPSPFFPPRLFHNRTVLAGLGIPFFFSAAYYLCVFPYFQSYLLVVKGESVTAAGHIVQIFVFVSTIMAITVSFLIKYAQRYKIFVGIGSCIYVTGMGLSARYRRQDASLLVMILCQVFVGIGGGLLIVPAQLGVQASVHHADVAAATALFLTILEVGGALGSAISGAIWTQNVLPKLQEYLPGDTRDQAVTIFGNITLAATGWAEDSPTKIAINRAYEETMKHMLTAAIIASVPLIVLSLMMKNHKLDEVEQHSKGGAEQELADVHEIQPLASMQAE